MDDNKKCKFCKREIYKSVFKRHEHSCYMNPKNKKECPVCGEAIKNYKKSTTCSYSCSNKHFRTGEGNGNWKQETYRSTCFLYHKKECIICKEDKIVAVHHLDENRNNNSPENLIPLCPTHHQYWHSKYRSEIKKEVETYIRNFING